MAGVTTGGGTAVPVTATFVRPAVFVVAAVRVVNGGGTRGFVVPGWPGKFVLAATRLVRGGRVGSAGNAGGVRFVCAGRTVMLQARASSVKAGAR